MTFFEISSLYRLSEINEKTLSVCSPVSETIEISFAICPTGGFLIVSCDPAFDAV